MKKTFLVIVTVALAGCTTVEDFRKMTPHERASRVCDRDREVQRLRAEKQTYASAISAAQDALGRGYRVHRTCEEVLVPTGSEKICQANGTQTTCRETPVMRRETRCRETPVPINPENERRNAADWSAAAAKVDQQLQGVYGQCYQRVLQLTPEQAYEQY